MDLSSKAGTKPPIELAQALRAERAAAVASDGSFSETNSALMSPYSLEPKLQRRGES